MGTGRLDPDGFATAVEDGLRWSYGTTAEILRAIWIPDIDEGLLVLGSPTSLARIEGGAIRYEGERIDDPEIGRLFVGEPLGAGIEPSDPVDLIAGSDDLQSLRPILEASRYRTVVAVVGLDDFDAEVSDLKAISNSALLVSSTLKGQGDLFLFGPLALLYEADAFPLRAELLKMAMQQGWLSEIVVYPYVRRPGWEWEDGVLKLAVMIHLRKLEAPDPERTRYVYFDGNSGDDFDDFYDDLAALVGAGLVNLDWVRSVELADAKDWSPTRVWFPAERSVAVSEVKTEKHHPLDRELTVQIHLQLQTIERELYNALTTYLKKVHGGGWWREGISEKTRREAASRQEMSTVDGPREAYLDLSDLVEILISHWKGLKRFLPDMAQLGADKARKELQFAGLLDIRNRDAHPLRTEHHPFTDQDLNFLTTSSRWVMRLAEGVANDLPP